MRDANVPADPGQSDFTPEAIDRIAGVLNIDCVAGCRLLASRLTDLVDVAHHCLNCRVKSSPSALVAELNRAAGNPLRFGDSVATLLTTTDHALAMDMMPALPLVSWQLALRIDSARPEDPSVQQAVRNRVKQHQYSAADLRDAILDAIKTVEPQVKRGRGGVRHEADWALEEVARHLLVIFHELTGRRGRPTFDAHSDQFKGLIIEFFELCLPPLGWRFKSRTAIRELIRKVLIKPDLNREPFQYG